MEPDPRIQAEHARRLSKYVFPKQYNLSNVFNQPARWKMGIPDFGDRESEIQVPILFYCLMTRVAFGLIVLSRRRVSVKLRND